MNAQGGVGQHGRCERVVSDEMTRLFGAPIADDHQLSACRVDARDEGAQLRDLLFAEQSAEVTDQRQQHRPVDPECPQSHRDAARIEHIEVVEGGCGIAHSAPIGGGVTLPCKTQRRGTP